MIYMALFLNLNYLFYNISNFVASNSTFDVEFFKLVNFKI